MHKKLSFFPLVILIISAVVSNRNLPAVAIFGAPFVFYFLFASLFFLLPVILVSSELSTYSSKTGGIYHWVEIAFGKRCAMVAIWLQWINSIVWYPTILSFLAGTSAYLFNPEFIHNKTYNGSFVILSFWTLTLLNLFQLQSPPLLNRICCFIGTIIPMFLVIIFGLIWLCTNQFQYITLSLKAMEPNVTNIHQWTILAAIMSCFARMELAGMHISRIQNASKTFPRALLTAGSLILISIFLGALSLAIVLPEKQIHLAGGLMQYFTTTLRTYHFDLSIFPIALLIVLGNLTTLLNWVLTPAKELHDSTKFGYLPKTLSKLNTQQLPVPILLIQALFVTLFSSTIYAFPSVNAFYWSLMALSCSIYMILYILMFLSAIRLRSQQKAPVKGLLQKNSALYTISLFGLIGATLTILTTHITPPDIYIATPASYALLILIGNIALILPIFLFIGKSQKIKKNS